MNASEPKVSLSEPKVPLYMKISAGVIVGVACIAILFIILATAGVFPGRSKSKPVSACADTWPPPVNKSDLCQVGYLPVFNPTTAGCNRTAPTTCPDAPAPAGTKQSDPDIRLKR